MTRREMPTRLEIPKHYAAAPLRETPFVGGLHRGKGMANSEEAGAHSGAFVLAVTGYEGFEEEVLRLRNANRAGSKSRQYLDWRYGQDGAEIEPRVYWVRTADGQAVGMAAVIFRAYRVDGERIWFAVLGDISLDTAFRSQGLGRRLLGFVTDDLRQNFPCCPGFVIPTPVAEKSLGAVGWHLAGQLVPHVLPLDLAERFARATRNEWLGALLARLPEILATLVWRHHARKSGLRLEVTAQLDDALDVLWSRYPKQGLILRELGKDALARRFAGHPDFSYRFGRILRGADLIGVVVFDSSVEEQICNVYDVLISDDRDLVPSMAVFVLHIVSLGGFRAIRFVTSDGHRYGGLLWRLGFVAREPQAVFQVFVSGNSSSLLGGKWQLTLGDKDI